MRGQTFQKKAKERVGVLGIFSDPKVGLCGLLKVIFLFLFYIYIYKHRKEVWNAQQIMLYSPLKCYFFIY
jgi:hypothetical protein